MCLGITKWIPMTYFSMTRLLKWKARTSIDNRMSCSCLSVHRPASASKCKWSRPTILFSCREWRMCYVVLYVKKKSGRSAEVRFWLGECWCDDFRWFEPKRPQHSHASWTPLFHVSILLFMLFTNFIFTNLYELLRICQSYSKMKLARFYGTRCMKFILDLIK